MADNDQPQTPETQAQASGTRRRGRGSAATAEKVAAPDPKNLRFFQAKFAPVSPAGLFLDEARPERALAMATP